MADYIELGALKEYLYGGKLQEGCTGCDEPGEGCIECIVDEIESFSAADVAPVRRGRWLDGVEGSMLRICSLCGFTAGAPSHRFCPACGAKMEVDYEN